MIVPSNELTALLSCVFLLVRLFIVHYRLFTSLSNSHFSRYAPHFVCMVAFIFFLCVTFKGLSSSRYFLKLSQFALEKLTFVRFAELTLTIFLLIKMKISMWSELRVGCVAHSVHKRSYGLEIVMSGELLTVGVILIGKSSFSTP